MTRCSNDFDEYSRLVERWEAERTREGATEVSAGWHACLEFVDVLQASLEKCTKEPRMMTSPTWKP
jgi:hypothetical protein